MVKGTREQINLPSAMIAVDLVFGAAWAVGMSMPNIRSVSISVELVFFLAIALHRILESRYCPVKITKKRVAVYVLMLTWSFMYLLAGLAGYLKDQVEDALLFGILFQTFMIFGVLKYLAVLLPIPVIIFVMCDKGHQPRLVRYNPALVSILLAIYSLDQFARLT